MSVMGMSLGFGFTKANIRFQRCFGIGCLEFEGWLLFDIYRTAYAVYSTEIQYIFKLVQQTNFHMGGMGYRSPHYCFRSEL